MASDARVADRSAPGSPASAATGDRELSCWSPAATWWCVKAHLVDDPGFRARWLVVYRRPTANDVTAVARFDTQGYRSPDWRGFIGESEPRTIEGLPGTWIGIDYDFLVGEDGETPGLPDEVVGCMAGT